MPINNIFSKNVLCNIITDNLDILRRCIEGTIYQQWTAVILLMQFIEYLLGSVYIFLAVISIAAK